MLTVIPPTILSQNMLLSVSAVYHITLAFNYIHIISNTSKHFYRSSPVLMQLTLASHVTSCPCWYSWRISREIVYSLRLNATIVKACTIGRRTIAMVTRYSQTMDINAWPACKCWRFVVQCCSSQAQALIVRPCVSKSDMTNPIQMSESCNIFPWLSTELRTTEIVLSTNAAHK